ncbi:LOW QUALITY PROTEIN: shieldin complex subunit 2 [Dromiciops gliroides]|uniref:LOW QUALITY PROTEIN: shieldin complex subunit 2 n=1 Tax=Dromiciops gliroides TaxID=33562 RepID=UPI001CC6A1A6|nr:LOW QUALITY PROTEIN: shieldin complex subunit 2 [Dromiciops gliroides]
MSKIPQIHIFFGAPIIPSNTTVSQEQTCSAANADPWKRTQLLYDHHSLTVSAEACRYGHLEGHHASIPVPLKEHIMVNSDKAISWNGEDCLTCVPETQCIESQNSDSSRTIEETQCIESQNSDSSRTIDETQCIESQNSDSSRTIDETQCIESQNSDSSRMIDIACYNEQIPKFESKVQQHLNERTCYYPVNENNELTDQQEKFESNSCFQSLLRKNSQPINQDCSSIWDLVYSTKQINIESEATGNDHIPSKNHETVSHYPEFFSPQITEEPESKGVIREMSSFSTSTDIEFLSIMTSSKIAFLAQSLDKEQSFLNKGTTSMKLEPKESCREMRLENSNNFVDGPNQANSLELFSPNCPETTSNLTTLNCNKGIKENIGSQELFKTPNEQPTDDFCIESFSTRKICSQQNTLHKVSTKRNRTSEDKSGPSSTVSESLQGPKRVKSVCSSDTHQISSKALPEKNVSKLGKLFKKTFLLKNCVCKNQKYNCLVMALHPCLVKEIHIKTGPNSGCKVPLATITVTDQSEIKKKVVLWRDTAFGVLTVFPGDIILLTDVTIHDDQWYRETVLQSTFTSQLLNLGSCSSVQPKEYSSKVSVTVLQDLLRYISSKYSYIVNLPFRHPQKLESIQYVELDQLQPNTLVHSILKVVSITALTEAVYGYRGQKQRKILLTVEQVQDRHFTLVLWGPGAAWYSELQRKKDHLWEFKYLLTLDNPTLENLELHTTPWSSYECLFEDDLKAIEFKANFQKRESHLVKISHLSALMEEKRSGVVQVKAKILALVFPVAAHESQQLVLDASTSLEDILTCLPTITYSGCKTCGAELQTDENKIYKQCVTCLPFAMVKLYYRSALMTVSDGRNEVCVHVGSEMIQKILLNIPPDWLSRVVVPSSGITYGMVAADLCHSLLVSRERAYTLKIQSLFILDENSYPLQQDFFLLDFHTDFEGDSP